MAFNDIHCDNSESSAADDREDILSSEERNVRIFTKQMLQGRLFLGHFQEKRLVEPVQGYRDVIIVNESEVQLKNDLYVVKKRLNNFYKHDYWIGITEPSSIGTPTAHCLWVESKNDKFGHYWFKIKSIRFRRKEILLNLKIVRPMTDFESETKNTNDNLQDVSIDVLLQNYKNSIKENFIWFLSEILTINNIVQALTFLSVLLMTLATYIIYGVQFLMEFFLRLMREISVFIQASTPVMIAVVNVFGKIIGGFYILIAMLFGKSPKPPSQRLVYHNMPRAIEMPGYGPSLPSHRSTMPYREPMIITEVVE